MEEILQFGLPSCGQCRVVERTLEHKGIEFRHIDCSDDENGGSLLAGQYDVQHVPTVIVLRDGRVEERLNNIPQVLEWIKRRTADEK